LKTLTPGLKHTIATFFQTGLNDGLAVNTAHEPGPEIAAAFAEAYWAGVKLGVSITKGNVKLPDVDE
jgi:hypothetical protein